MSGTVRSDDELGHSSRESSMSPAKAAEVDGLFQRTSRDVLPTDIRTKRRRAAAARCRSRLSSASRMMSDGLTLELRSAADDTREEVPDPAGSTEESCSESGCRWMGGSTNEESDPEVGLEAADMRQEVLVIIR